MRQGRTAGGKERERASERAVEGAAADKRERKYERSRVKRTNKQPRPLASRPQLRVRAAEGEEEREERRWTDESREETVNEYKREEEARCATRERDRANQERGRDVLYICLYIFLRHSCAAESR